MSKLLIFGALLAGMSGVAAYTLHGPCGSCGGKANVVNLAATPKSGPCCEKSPGTVCCADCTDCDNCCIDGICACCGLACEDCCMLGGCCVDCCTACTSGSAKAPAVKAKAKCCDGCCEKNCEKNCEKK